MRYVVGIDIGGTNIVAGPVAEDGSELPGQVSGATPPQHWATARGRGGGGGRWSTGGWGGGG